MQGLIACVLDRAQVGLRVLASRPKPPPPPEDAPDAYVRGGVLPMPFDAHTRIVAVDPGRKAPVTAVAATAGMLPGLPAMLQRQGSAQAGPFPREPHLRPDDVPHPQPPL